MDIPESIGCPPPTGGNSGGSGDFGNGRSGGRGRGRGFPARLLAGEEPYALLDNCEFVNCTVSGSGNGAVYICLPTIEITSCCARGCSSYESGFLYALSSPQLFINKTFIVRCVSRHEGTLYFFGRISAVISDCNISECSSADDGSGLVANKLVSESAVYSNQLNVTSSQFFDSTGRRRFAIMRRNT
jgi:hypothetical protein